ncbi:hypothetical protein E4U39_000276, partial [Claviceps sp. Clav50 group G5]
MHKSDLREEDFKAPWFALQYSSERQYNWETTWAWVIRTDYATGKACSKVADGQLESCKPRIVEETITLPGMRQYRWVICANASGGESDYHQKAWWEPRFDKFVTQITRILTSDDELPCHDSCY